MNQKIMPFLLCFILVCSTVSLVSSTIEPKSLTATTTDIISMIQQVNHSLVYDFHDTLMGFGPRYTGSDNCSAAAQWIEDEFQAMGLDTNVHAWEYNGFSSQNIVATLPGVDPDSTAEILMTAHYDCTPGSLGADDDGSGVAAVMAAASIMNGYSFNHTIKFIAFSGEEVGTYGSFCYARDAYANGDNIYAVINLDMIGWANSTKGGQFLRFHCPDRSWWIGGQAQDIAEFYHEYTNLSVETRPNYVGADHQPFIDYGFDGVWIAHHDGHPWANSPEDTPEHLNWTYQVKATKALLAIVAEFASQPISIQVMFTSPEEARLYLFDIPLFPLHLGKQWYKGLRGTTVILGRTTVTVNVLTEKPIDRVIYCIDGNFIVSLGPSDYTWKIQGKHYFLTGQHTLQVYAYTTDNDVAYDDMDIRILSFSCQYGNR